MIRVIEILPGSRLVIDGAGLCRVVLGPERRTIAELLPESEADDMVDACNGCGVPGIAAASIPYSELCA